jgi:steroid 5-alpha reductase family enzyme
LSILAAAQNSATGLRLADFAGAALMVAAIAGEGLADRQLSRFKTDPHNAGGICDVGLWSWSRHPNYFFEWLGWFAYPLIAIDLTGAYPWGWAAFAAPALMYWVLNYHTGLPYLETHMARSRGEAWRSYRARTNAFVPWPPIGR